MGLTCQLENTQQPALKSKESSRSEKTRMYGEPVRYLQVSPKRERFSTKVSRFEQVMARELEEIHKGKDSLRGRERATRSHSQRRMYRSLKAWIQRLNQKTGLVETILSIEKKHDKGGKSRICIYKVPNPSITNQHPNCSNHESQNKSVKGKPWETECKEKEDTSLYMGMREQSCWLRKTRMTTEWIEI